MPGTVFKTLSVVLSASTGSFRGEMLAAAKVARDFNSEVNRIGKSSSFTSSGGIQYLAQESKLASNAISGIAAAAGAVGLAVAGGFAVGTKAALDFDQTMRNVSSLIAGSSQDGPTAAAQQAQGAFDSMSKSVLELSRTVPQSPNDLAKGLYDIVSVGYQGADALKVLQVSATAASAGLATTQDSVDAITGVLKSYGYSVDQATAVSDVLFQTVNVGRVTFSELAQNIGQVTPLASQAGVPIQDLGAAIATITLHGIKADEAATGLKRAIQQLLRPGKDLSATLHEIGFESGQAAITQLGFAGTLQAIDTASGHSAAAIESLFGDVRAATAVMSLSANGGRDYATALEQIALHGHASGATLRTLAEQSKSVKFQFDVLRNNLEATFISEFRKASPAIASFIGNLIKATEQGGALSGVVKDAHITLRAFELAAGDTGLAIVRIGKDLAPIGILMLDFALKSANAFADAVRWVGIAALAFDHFKYVMVGLAQLASGDIPNAMKTLAGAHHDAADATDKTAKATESYADKLGKMLGLSASDIDSLKNIGNAGSDAADGLDQATQAQKDLESAFANFASPKSTFDKVQQDLTDAQQKAQQQQEEHTRKSFEGQRKAVEENYKKQHDALNRNKSDISNHSRGSSEAIQGEISKLEEKKQADLDSLQTAERNAQETERATRDSSKKVVEHLGDYIKGLKESNKAFEDWRNNLEAIGKRTHNKTLVATLAGFGPDAAPLVAEAAKAPQKELDDLQESILRGIELGSVKTADATTQQWDDMASAAGTGADQVAATVARKLGVGVDYVQQVMRDYNISITQGVNAILQAIGQAPITENFSNPATFTVQQRPGGPLFTPRFAEGGVENHVAQIAAGGPMRIWAEPETGGEAYIPLSPAKRGRSTSILAQVADMFDFELGAKAGGHARRFAAGGILSTFSVANPPPLPPWLIDAPASSAMIFLHDAVSKFVDTARQSQSGGAAGNAPVAPQGQIVDWIHAAEAIANWPDTYTNGIYQLIMHESGGRPDAVNRSDSNAAAGHPSKGITQTIDGTFRAHAFPGHGDIFNPIDNILAGISYALGRYGPGMVIAGGRHDAKGRYLGYDSGGPLMPGWTAAYNGTGKPEHVLTEKQIDRIVAAVENNNGPKIGNVTIEAKDTAYETVRELRRQLG